MKSQPPSDTKDGVDVAVAHPGRALSWSFLNTASGRFGTLAIGIVLARVLGPVQFGTFAVALVALMAMLSFNELGVSLAIVRWRGDPARIAPTVTTISIASSAVLTIGVLALAGPFARMMGDPGATPVVQVLSVCILINGLVATPAALMQRRFMQRERMLADQVNTWVGAVLSLALALGGLGAMSLAIGRLAGAGLSAVMLIRFSPLPLRLGWDTSCVRALLSFGVPLAGASMVVFCVGFIDQVMVGTLLGSVALGYYVLAANLASWPVTLVSQPLRSVAPALFARLQGQPDRMRSDFRKVLRLTMGVSLPITLVLSVLAEDIVALLYGDEWLPAAQAFRWLAVLAALRIFFELTYDYIVVLNRSAKILVINLAWLTALLPVMWFAVQRWGMVGAGMALVCVSIAVSVPMYVFELRRVGIGIAQVLGSVWEACAVAVGAASLVLLLAAKVNSPLATCLLGALLAGSAAGAVTWLHRRDVQVFRRVAL